MGDSHIEKPDRQVDKNSDSEKSNEIHDIHKDIDSLPEPIKR